MPRAASGSTSVPSQNSCLSLRCRRRRWAGAVGGDGTTRHALAARVRLGSIRAHRVRMGRGGNGSRRALPHPPIASGRRNG